MELSRQKQIEVQKQALEVVLQKHGHGTLAIDTGVGKCKIAIDYILWLFDHRLVNDPAYIEIDVLITSPRENLKDNWLDEFIKWDWSIISQEDSLSGKNISRVDLRLNTNTRLNQHICIYFANVQTAYKLADDPLHGRYDLIIGDEAHLLMTPEYCNVFNIECDHVLCLTATPDIKNKPEKLELYNKYAPIIFTYLTAEEDGVVNKVNLIIIDHKLNNNFKTIAGTKARPFPIGEEKNYAYLSTQIATGQTLMGEQRHILYEHENLLAATMEATGGADDYFSLAQYWYWQKQGNSDQKNAARIYLTSIGKRRDMLLGLNSTAHIAKRVKEMLLRDAHNKVLIFSELTKQCNKISTNVYHSKNAADSNKANLEAFNNGAIRDLASCYSLTLGLNMSSANRAIFESYQGSETLAKQRGGRLHRLPTDQSAVLYVIRVLGTQSEEWFNKFLSREDISQVISSIPFLI